MPYSKPTSLTIAKSFCILTLFAEVLCSAAPPERRPVLYNGDEDWIYLDGPEYIDRHYLESIVNNLAAAHVTIFSDTFYAAGRCWYDTKSGDRFDTDRSYVYCPEAGPFTDLKAWRMTMNFRRLVSEGNDPIQVFAEVAHARKLKFLACLRMNDRHSFNVKHPPVLIQQHPDLAMKRRDGTVIGGMDFQYAEVRGFLLARMEELVTKYDVDGIELDWMRWVQMFSEGVPKDKRQLIMTDYHRHIRKMLDRVGKEKGRHLLLAIRVPSTLEECESAGFDVAAYVHEGLIDVLCPSDFIFLDPRMPVDQFHKLTLRSTVLLLPSLHPLAGAKAGWASADNLRAVAHSYYIQGADGISAYNWYAPEINSPEEPTGLEHFPVLQEMGLPEVLARQPREYLFNPLWAPTSWAPTAPTGRRIDWEAVVSRSSPGQRQVVPIIIKEDLSKVRAKLKCKIAGLTSKDTLQIDVNGKKLASGDVKVTYLQHGKQAWKEEWDAGWVTEQPYYVYEVDNAGPLLRDGANEIGISLEHAAPALDIPITLFEVRVAVQ